MPQQYPPERWTIPLRFVTPAFVGGAEPNEQASVRPASIRGALRAWYRLLVGPEVAAGLDKTKPDLAEDRLFGGTRAGVGQGAVLLSLSQLAPEGREPWDNRSRRSRTPGLAYLGFAFDMSPNRRVYLKPGTRFRLQLTFPRGVRPEARERIAATLWLWLTLGGLGSRSRRGFGSLCLDGPVQVETPARQPLPLPAILAAPAPNRAEASLLADHLFDQLDRVMKVSARPRPRRGAAASPAAGAGEGRDPGADPAYRLDYSGPRGSRVVLWPGSTSRGFATAEEAHEAIGVVLSTFRKQMGIDGLHTGALRILAAGQPLERAPARAALGLPLALRPVGKGGGAGFELLPRVNGKVHGRAPSPLLFRIAPLGDRFAVILTLLSGPWPGRDIDLIERRQARGYIPKSPTIDTPNQLLNGLVGKYEVEL